MNEILDFISYSFADVINQEVTLKNSDSRSPLNNRSNVLTKEEFYKNSKNRPFSKPQACVPGKENAKK